MILYSHQTYGRPPREFKATVLSASLQHRSAWIELEDGDILVDGLTDTQVKSLGRSLGEQRSFVVMPSFYPRLYNLPMNAPVRKYRVGELHIHHVNRERRNAYTSQGVFYALTEEQMDLLEETDKTWLATGGLKTTKETT